MSSSVSVIYLVTGANRGIGLGLVEHILSTHTGAFVYAGVRDPTRVSSLRDIERRYPGCITIVKCVSADVESNTALATIIANQHGRIDTVIANAGMASIVTSALETHVSVFEDNFQVNVLGPLVLFQAVHNLLKASSAPRFVPISTGGASIGGPTITLPMGLAAYGSSKAALNYLTRKIHFENEWLVAFPLAPGTVATDAVNDNIAQDSTGKFHNIVASHLQTVEDASSALVKIIDEATREKDGGEFLNVDGTKIPW